MENIRGKGGNATLEQTYLFYVTGNNNYQRMLGHDGFPAAESCPGG